MVPGRRLTLSLGRPRISMKPHFPRKLNTFLKVSSSRSDWVLRSSMNCQVSVSDDQSPSMSTRGSLDVYTVTGWER